MFFFLTLEQSSTFLVRVVTLVSAVDSSTTVASTFSFSVRLLLTLVLAALEGVMGIVPGRLRLGKASDFLCIGDGDLCIDHLQQIYQEISKLSIKPRQSSRSSRYARTFNCGDFHQRLLSGLIYLFLTLKSDLFSGPLQKGPDSLSL